LQRLTGFLAERLKLTVNTAKSAVARPWQRKFLGYSLTWHPDPKLRIAASSLERLTEKVNVLLRGARGRNLGATIQTLNPLLRGWAAYFKLTQTRRRWKSGMGGYGISFAVSCGDNGSDLMRGRVI
jgi:RNA-directed DNA polymerase